MSENQDFCPIQGFDHVEFYVGNAKQAAKYYELLFGFTPTAYRGLETGAREVASHVMEQGSIRLVLTSALLSDHPVARHAYQHGDSVSAIGLRVPDVEAAYRESTQRGAEGVRAPITLEDSNGILRVAEVQAYGDTLLRFVERDHFQGVFAPGFEARQALNGGGVGLRTIDHVVGNVELGKMNQWVGFFAKTLGFSQLAHFDDEAISTEYSALMSKVMQDGSGKIKFPINEPAQGKKKSQIEEFLEFHEGPGAQHLACETEDILVTVGKMRANGVEFLEVPRNYYDEIEARVGSIEEPLDELADLGILIDRDEDGYLLQIFTKPVEDRPTVFYEVIERNGARGFGEGNFKALFEALEHEQELRGNL